LFIELTLIVAALGNCTQPTVTVSAWSVLAEEMFIEVVIVKD